MLRLIGNIFVLVSLASLPFWMTLAIILFMCLTFDFVEIVLYGYVLDLMYSVPTTFLSAHIYLILAVGIYGMMIFIKPYIKF